MRILFTQHALDRREGTELFVLDLARALLERGHRPVAVSRRLGEVAAELRRETVPVFDDVGRVHEPPDVLHLQHHLEAMTALVRFPGTPAVHVCHGWLPDEEAPVDHPRILRWVAVDELVRERLVDECGIEPDRVEVFLNFVDLRRFPPRETPLPERPRRALVFSNRVSEDDVLPVLREACRRCGVELDAMGLATETDRADPGVLLGSYDVVFAKGRAALEAAAVGAAVVLCDRAGLGPLVTRRELSRLRSLNLGVRLLREPVTADAVVERLDGYDAADAADVSRQVRAEAGLDAAVENWIGLYERVVGEHRERPHDPVAEGRAVARYLRHGPLAAGDFSGPERQRLGERSARAEERARMLEDLRRGAAEEVVRQVARADAAEAALEEGSARARALEEALTSRESENRVLRERVEETEASLESWRLRAEIAEAEVSRLGERLEECRSERDGIATELDVEKTPVRRWRKRIFGNSRSDRS